MCELSPQRKTFKRCRELSPGGNRDISVFHSQAAITNVKHNCQGVTRSSMPPTARKDSVRIRKVEGACKAWKLHTKRLCAQKYLESRFLIRARTSLCCINNNVEHMLPRLFAQPQKLSRAFASARAGRHAPRRDSCSSNAVATWWLDLGNSDYLSTCTWPRRNIKNNN